MKVIVFGATGATGRLVVQEALAHGHDVTAYVRNAFRLDIRHPKLMIVVGELDDEAAMAAAIEGQHAVVCALGAPVMNTDGVRAWGTQKIIDAMLKTHVNRLVCLSSFGVGDSYEHLPPLYRYAIVPFLLRRVIKDHNAQENIVRRSGLQWTFVRPVNLTHAHKTGRYVCGAGKPAQKLSMKISREDVAAFMVSQLSDSTYLHKAPFMSYAAKCAQPSMGDAKNARA